MARPIRLAGAALSLAAAAALLAQGVRESVQVGLVSVRVDVRDKDGKAIPDLTAADVKLKVDGKEVAIEGLDRIGPVAATTVVKTPEAPTAAPTLSTIPVSPAPSDLYLAILVDETASNPYDRREAFRQLETFLGRGSPGMHVQVQRFDGQLHVECPWTTDVGAALAAAKKMGKRLQDSRLPSPSELREEIRQGRKPKDVQFQVDLYSRRSFDAILQALIRFPEVPGRRGLVVITDGTPFISPFDFAMMFSDSDANSRDDRSLRAEALRAQGETAAAKQIEDALAQQALATFSDAGPGQNTAWNRWMALLTSKALELDIAFYPMDSEEPDRGTNPSAGSKWPGRSMPGVVGGGSSVPVAGSGMTSRMPVIQSMMALADITGGQAILVPRKAGDGLSDIATRPPSEYMLTFKDPFPADAKYHKVEITIARAGARVSYRKGYRVRSEEERILDSVVAGLAEPPQGRNPLSARAEMNVLREDGGRKIVEMRLEYTPAEAPGARAEERDLDVWAVCTDDAGNRAKPIHRQVRATRAPAGSAFAYQDSFQLGLPAGPYTWSLALKDRPTGAVSYVVIKKTV
jgi:VWFA-related protein